MKKTTAARKRGRPRKSAVALAASGSWRAKERRIEEAAGWIPPVEANGIVVDQTPTPIYQADRPAVVTLFADSSAGCRLTVNGRTFRLRPGVVSKTPIIDRLALPAGETITATVDRGEATVYGYADLP
jgi:hypothetical protein